MRTVLASLLVCAAAATAGAVPILPIGTDGRLGCVVAAERTVVTAKGPRGSHVAVAPRRAARQLAAEKTELRRDIRKLRRAGGSPEELARLETARAGLVEALADLKRCKRGDVAGLDADPISFRFLCLHGLWSPSASVTGDDCGVNLRHRLPAPGTPGGEAPYTKGVVTLLDDVLRPACEREGGTYLRNVEAYDGFHPLYHAVCQRPGAELFVDQAATIEVLAMEQENPDCFLSPFTGVPGAAGAKDPCDCYDPDAPRGGGGTTGDPRPPPAAPDCIILRMDVENPDC